MSGKPVPDILVDMITGVTFTNGVFRVSLAQVGPDKQPEPVARLFIPANQFSPILAGLTRAGRNIVTQLRERRDSPADAAAPAASRPAKAKPPAKRAGKAAGRRPARRKK
jgi:hypothetical protein